MKQESRVTLFSLSWEGAHLAAQIFSTLCMSAGDRDSTAGIDFYFYFKWGKLELSF